MIKVSMPIIVEGKYDRIKLAQFIDGVIIETSGFKVFKNKELIDSLRNLSLTKGIIVLTDSDSSGFKIRNFLKSVLPQNAKITDVYIPQIKGKEKRKISSSSEGLLGVEGLDEDTIISCFDRAKITSSFKKNTISLTKSNLYDLGLIGKKDSAQKRREILKKMSLPTYISANTMIKMINMLLTEEEFTSLL